jgi:beclin
LDMLMQFNALNECFYISHSGSFGTINCLRLGLESISLEQPVEPANASPAPTAPESRRYFSFTAPLPASNATSPSLIRVPWTEINAALGQVALLLLTMEKFTLSGIHYRHQIVHQGSTTKIGIRRAGGTAVSLYNLYHDDSFQLFGRRNFNIAIECLCECVWDAAEAVQKRDHTITLPYALERVKGELLIGKLPASIAFGQDGTEWTRAMKYLLTDIKHIMTFRPFLGSNCRH